MTYLAYPYRENMSVAIGGISYASAIGVNDDLICTLSYDGCGVVGSGTSSLTLGEGHYLVSAIVGASATNAASDSFDFAIFLDGQWIGAKGGRQPTGKVGADAAEAAFSVIGSTSELNVRVTDKTGTISVLSDYSQIYIRKVAL